VECCLLGGSGRGLEPPSLPEPGVADLGAGVALASELCRASFGVRVVNMLVRRFVIDGFSSCAFRCCVGCSESEWEGGAAVPVAVPFRCSTDEVLLPAKPLTGRLWGDTGCEPLIEEAGDNTGEPLLLALRRDNIAVMAADCEKPTGLECYCEWRGMGWWLM
jgi:hypothetical protein